MQKKKVGLPRKTPCLFGLPFFNCRSNSDEGFARLVESSFSISKLCVSEAASYYNIFNMRKHKMTLFENTINDNAELIYRFLGWAHLLSTMMVPTE